MATLAGRPVGGENFLDRQLLLMGKVKSLDDHKHLLRSFLENFTNRKSSGEQSSYPPASDMKYRNELQAIFNRQSRTLNFFMDDLYKYATECPEADISLYNSFVMNTHRYLELLYEAIDNSLNSGVYERYNFDTDDPRLIEGTYNSMVDQAEVDRQVSMQAGKVPAHLRANHQIILVPGKQIRTRTMRNVNADVIGNLSKFEADVVRVTLVKPRLLVAAYECQKCHQDTFKAVDGFNFMPLTDCPSCRINSISASLKFNLRKSKFTKYQEIRVQEPAHQVPEGDVPRSLNCVVFGELVKKIQPGISVTLCGILLPVAKFGFAAMKSGLSAEKYFHVCSIDTNKKAFDENDEDYLVLQEKISALKKEPGLYDKLARSIAPEIWGMEDVKKCLLLQLIGGCSKEKSDGGTIRGDIHVLLMGDPGVAKSQLMKKVHSISHRSVYTTGKGSSSVGLTAAIVKDPNTGETTLEGGALVLADRGICCIDEFDKMDEFDRSAIYEVMEQQTVSIAKAGHCSTMPARTAVLAAANPVDGKYDVKKPFMVNMNLPAALLSRFDVQFLLLDQADRMKDTRLARHVLEVYRSKPSLTASGEAPSGVNGYSANAQTSSLHVDSKTLRAFISVAKRRTPVLDQGVVDEIKEWYVTTRKVEYSQSFQSRTTYTTPRSLLAILRLSQALARLRDSDTIELGDFEEAVRLNNVSKPNFSKLYDERRKKKSDPMAEIMEIIRDTRLKLQQASKRSNDGWDGWIPMAMINRQISSKGMLKAEFERVLTKYFELAVLIPNDAATAFGFPEDIVSTGVKPSHEDDLFNEHDMSGMADAPN